MKYVIQIRTTATAPWSPVCYTESAHVAFAVLKANAQLQSTRIVLPDGTWLISMIVDGGWM